MTASRSQTFLDEVEEQGYSFFTGVPCSYFGDVIQILESGARYGYVSAVREDSSIGIAAGAFLAGRQPVVLMQNSGLGVAINALVSLNQIYDIPVLLVISWRGQFGDDAPEHLVMGAILEDLFRLLQIPFAVYDTLNFRRQLAELTRTMRETRKPVALVVPREALEE
ncbi:MAG TPA: hypothetical protein VIX89_01240 [Bryobacteraceae bacterium]